MEMFPATDDDAWTLIQRVIDESDYYLLVVGGKYGTLDPKEDISYTEHEFDYAVAAKKPIIAFLHGDLNSLTVEKSEKSEDMQNRLAEFRAKVETSKHVKYWTSPEQLAGMVALSFNKITRQSPGVGWMRADRAASLQTLRDLNTAQARVTELESALESTQTSPPPGSLDLAQGTDKFVIPNWATGSFRNAARTIVQAGKWIRYETTWDATLAAVAPNLLVDAEEDTLKSTLQEWILLDNYEATSAALLKVALEADNTTDLKTDASNLKTMIDGEDFGTILLQFKALGLVERSGRKRSVNDTGTYWTLTTLGEKHAIQVRAIKRTPGEASVVGTQVVE
jgi:hypothetical protein